MKKTGLAASKGIAVGKIMIYKNDITFSDGFIEDDERLIEIERFNSSVDKTKADIISFLDTNQFIDETQREIMNAHSEMVGDPTLSKMIKEKINNKLMNTQTALRESINELETMFLNMDSEYMRQRAVDIKDVGNRMLKNLLGIKDEKVELEECVIIVAKDLMPSDMLRFDKSKIMGFITETGGVTSHVAIIARGSGIPAVLGVSGICNEVQTDDVAIVDGRDGHVFINPKQTLIESYLSKKSDRLKEIEENKKIKDVKAVTSKGKHIKLGVNIGSADDIQLGLDNGAEKIGLFRTEFVFMGRTQLPSEDEQFNIYKEVFTKMKNKPVIIRTIDVGGDKNIPYLGIKKEENPFLGVRGIRYCLRNKDVFITQIRAIIRASEHCEITILLPMVSCVDEVIEAKKMIDQEKMNLMNEGHQISDHICIGAMIEVPSAALSVSELADYVDYFSIGTNDLCQYVLAIDRMNQGLSDLYNPNHPAIHRLIKMICQDAHAREITVGVCGEMAGDTKFTELLLEAGVDELSMSALSIPDVKKEINFNL